MRKVSGAFRASLEEAHERADELIESRQWLQTTLESVGDALIACNHQRRVELMNPVAQHLTGWTLEDAKGRRLETVFRTIDEETREEVKNLGSWADPKDPAATNHSLLLSKDGTEYLIDQSAAFHCQLVNSVCRSGVRAERRKVEPNRTVHIGKRSKRTCEKTQR